MKIIKTLFRGYRRYEIGTEDNRFFLLENGICKSVCNSLEATEKGIENIIKDKLNRKQALKRAHARNRRRESH